MTTSFDETSEPQSIEVGRSRNSKKSMDSRNCSVNWDSTPKSSEIHLFNTQLGTHALLVGDNSICQVSPEIEQQFTQALRQCEDSAILELFQEVGLNPAVSKFEEQVEIQPVRSLSLAVAQKCNLGCTYCYASQGDFGGTPKNMSREVAMDSLALLFKEARSGERVNLAFLGGEPLINKALIHECTREAIEFSKRTDVSIGFSITTNGTLLTEDDASFFEEHGFAVTVSLDGEGKTHDSLRPFKNGRGSYDQIIENLKPLLARQKKMQVSARVTVTPRNLDLAETLESLVNLGFHSVGFSPMLSSPTGRDELNGDDLKVMLSQMIACGELFETKLLAKERFPFSNMASALKEIHRGSVRPYACGAGVSYFGVSADGDLAACHRFVGDAIGSMGNLADGVDKEAQEDWMKSRHVERQEPCKSCWARNMCGGGCHHEVINRGRPACEFIRGWLHYCMQAYVRLLGACPEYFAICG